MATQLFQPPRQTINPAAGPALAELRSGAVVLDRAMMHLRATGAHPERYSYSRARAQAYKILFACRMLLHATDGE